MMTLLVFRARIRSLYQKYELYIDPVVKFIVAFIVFQLINTAIGYDVRLKKLPIVLAISLLSAFTPSAVLVLLATLMAIGHVYFVSKILSIIIILIMLIMYCFFIRFTPKSGYVVVVIPILFLLKIPYLMPLLLGLFATPITIIPTSCGVIAYYLFLLIRQAKEIKINISVEDTLQLYTNVANSLVSNKLMLMSIIIFSFIIVVTYFVRRMKFDYAHQIAVVSGALACILGFLISSLRLNATEQILPMILGTLVSAVLAVIIQFFHITLDYTGVEHVQFEDEDYYYYVKAVPKINVTTPEINVKRINAQKFTGIHGDFKGDNKSEVLHDIDDDYEDDYEDYEGYDKNSRDEGK